MPKKFSFLSKLLILALFFSFIGCTPKVDSNDEKSTDKLNITFIGATTTGTLFMIINAIGECVERSYPGSVVTIISGSVGVNPTRISNNEADASLTHNVTAFAAIQGKPPFGEKTENIASIASLYPSVLQIAVTKQAGIYTMDEFINNKMPLKFSLGQRGSNTDILFNEIIAEYGITIDDIQAWGGEIVYQGISNTAQMLADGSIDGGVFSILVPIPQLLEASRGDDFTILKINQQVLQILTEQYNYEHTIIPAESYPFMKEDIPTICSYTIVIVPADSSDEAAYKIAASITEHIEYLHTVHVSLENITTESLVTNLGIPLHPGAEKYYREQGIIK